MHFVIMAHQLAWMEHPVIWLCASCAILWLVLRVVRSPLIRTGVLLMLCGLGMNALVTDTQCRVDARGRNASHSASCEPECGRARHCKRGCHCWRIKHGSDCLASATSLCSSGVFLLWPFAFDGRWNGDARMCRRLHDAPQPSTICDLALAGNLTPIRQTPETREGVPTFPDC